MRRNELWITIGKSPSGRKTYSISNYGRCKTHDNITGCVTISRGSLNPYTGYCSFNGQYVHRLVAKYFLRNPNPTLYTEVDHIRPDKKINRATNLRYVTVSQNRKRLHKKRA